MKIIYFSKDYSPHDHRFLAALSETEHEVYYLKLEKNLRQVEDRPVPENIQQILWAGGQGQFRRDDEEESSLLKKLLRAKDSTIVSAFGGKRIVREPVPIAKDEPLKLELQDFVNCVREKHAPVVSGESAKRALDLAFEITRQVQAAKT